MTADCRAPLLLLLPDSIENSTKVRFVSGLPHQSLPPAIEPATEDFEQKIVTALLAEINEQYTMNLHTDPDLARSSALASAAAELPQSRVFVIGASHLKRVVGGLAQNNIDVIDLSRAGWIANDQNLAELATKLTMYNISDQDVVLIDLLSNSIFCGTDSKGNLLDPVKIDDTWHIPGDLTFAPKTVVKAILNEATRVLFGGVGPDLIAMLPVPRYVSEKCCKDSGHVANINAPDYLTDMEKNTEMLEELVYAWAQGINPKSEIFHFRTAADDAEQPLDELTVNGEPMWRFGEPVHCCSDFYHIAAEAIASRIGGGDDESVAGPQSKRPRLESVVVKRIGSDRASKPKKPTASWSTGTLPPQRGGGGRGGRGPFRGRFPRGFRRGWARPYRARGWRN